MNPITTLLDTLHRAMHRLPGMTPHSEAAARASAWAARMNRPRRPHLPRA